METKKFIKAKVNAYKPQFKQLIGLQESDKTNVLIDFMLILHPNQDYIAKGSRGEVFGNKHYIFNIYKTGILRTIAETTERKFFPLNVD